MMSDPGGDVAVSGEQKSSNVGRLFRSASWERKRRGSNAKDRGTATHGSAPARTTESDTSSANTGSARDDGRPLRSWLHKRHQKDASVQTLQWAWRFFSVDDVRGTLSYSKSEKRKPSAILPLADITNVKVLEGGKMGDFQWCFLISCPPVHFTVRAKDFEERDFWLHGLSARAAKWKEKLNPSCVEARATTMARPLEGSRDKPAGDPTEDKLAGSEWAAAQGGAHEGAAAQHTSPAGGECESPTCGSDGVGDSARAFPDEPDLQDTQQLAEMMSSDETQHLEMPIFGES